MFRNNVDFNLAAFDALVNLAASLVGGALMVGNYLIAVGRLGGIA